MDRVIPAVAGSRRNDPHLSGTRFAVGTLVDVKNLLCNPLRLPAGSVQRFSLRPEHGLHFERCRVLEEDPHATVHATQRTPSE
jgi:hypothetical protein